jgi:hypothetical protein
MPRSTYLDKLIINAVFASGTFTSPTATYVALLTGSVTKDGIDGYNGATYTEPAESAGYARQACVFNTDTPFDGYASNSTILQFGPSSTTAWDSITGIAVFDNQTYNSGNCLYYSALSTSIAPPLGSLVVIQAANFVIGED